MNKGFETKEHILKAALDFTSKLGLEALSIGELAKKVGMSKSGLFGHFNSKEKLQIMVIDYAAQNFIKCVVLPALDKKRGIERIRSMAKNWLDWSGQNFTGGCPFIAAAFEYDDRPGAIRDHIKKYQEDLIQTFTRAAEIAVEEDEFKSDSSCSQFAFEFYSFMLGQHVYNRLLLNKNTIELYQCSFETLLQNYSHS
jgi:AcrR family transcriptional regulator